MDNNNLSTGYIEPAIYPNNIKEVKAVSLTDLLNMNLPPRENLLDPWLPKSGLCMVYATRGIGKTFFALEVTMAIACGINFLSFRAPHPAKVLYIDGEMPANVMQSRLRSIKERINSAHPNIDIIEPLLITPDLQGDCTIDLSTNEGHLLIEKHTKNAELIVIDNISTLAGSLKENDATDWMPFQQLLLKLRKQGKSVLLVHHAGKGGNQRGTSKREDILDTVIALKRPNDYEASDGASFELYFEKNRGILGDDTKPIFCQLVNNNWSYSTLEESNYAKAIALYNEGLQQKDIVLELNISKSQVSKIIKKGKSLGEIKRD